MIGSGWVREEVLRGDADDEHMCARVHHASCMRIRMGEWTDSDKHVDGQVGDWRVGGHGTTWYDIVVAVVILRTTRMRDGALFVLGEGEARGRVRDNGERVNWTSEGLGASDWPWVVRRTTLWWWYVRSYVTVCMELRLC